MKPSIAIGMMPPSYGSGLGVSQNNFWKERSIASGKHGIYPGKGEWDEDIDYEDDEIDKIDFKIAKKMSSSSFQIPNDSKTKPDHKSAGNLGSHNLVSHAEKNGNLLYEYIKEVLKEESISGRSYIRKSLGDPYHTDSNDIGSGISRAKVSPRIRSIQIPNTTASGTKDMNYLNTKENDFSEIEDDQSSFDVWLDFNLDVDNLKKHNKRKFS